MRAAGERPEGIRAIRGSFTLLGAAFSLLLMTTAAVAEAAPQVSGATAAPAATDQDQRQQPLDVIYVPTPHDVVERMLEVADVGPGDVVYDLGSGDGRIPIAAVRDFGAARGVGIELDPARVAEARANAREAGVSDRVEFRQEDLFRADLSPASVIAMYLLPALNLRLMPTLQGLARGTRIVSHNYDMGTAWKPQRSIVVDNNLVHLWVVGRR